MPLFKITTNTPEKEDTKKEFLKDASKQLSQLLGKSEDYVMTVFESESVMTYAGNDDPTAYVEIKSLGLTADQTKILSKQFCELIERKLNINQSRVYIEFSNPDRPFWGWNGKTF